jgi:hypothetical protein
MLVQFYYFSGAKNTKIIKDDLELEKKIQSNKKIKGYLIIN